MADQVKVGDEVFDVSRRGGNAAVYDFVWVQGRHDGDYGFSTASYDGRKLDSEQLEEAVRNFLADIDPKTGYIRERD